MFKESYLKTKHTFHYLEQVGVGAPILLLHSTGIGSRQWLPYFTILKERHLLAIDFLDYGKSSKWTESASIEDDFDAAEKLLLQQDQPVDIIGHSYGGVHAMRLAQRHPQAVRSLLLHEPVAWGSIFNSQKSDLIEDFLTVRNTFFSTEYPSGTEEWLEGFVDFWNQPGTWSQFPTRTKDIWRTQASKVYAEVYNLCFDDTPVFGWNNLTHPTCITMSYSSPPAEREVCRLLFQTLPNCTLVEHDGGHLAPVTHFRAIEPIVSRWFNDSNQ